MLRSLAASLCLTLFALPAVAQQGTAFRDGQGTELAPAPDGTRRFDENSGWSDSNFDHAQWAVEYNTTLSDAPWAVALPSGRTNAGFTAAANQLIFDLGGNTYTVLPYLENGTVKGGFVKVVDRSSNGAFLKIVNGTFDASQSRVIVTVGAESKVGRLLVENATLRSSRMWVSDSNGSSGFVTIGTGGQIVASTVLEVGPLGQGHVLLNGSGATLTALQANIGAIGSGSVTLDNPTALFHLTKVGNGGGDLWIDNTPPAQLGTNIGLIIKSGLVQVDGNARLATRSGSKYGAVSIEGGTFAVAGNVHFGASGGETDGGKIYLHDGRVEVTTPSSFQIAPQRHFYWDAGTVAFTAPTVTLSDVQLQNLTRQGALSYGGPRAAGTLAEGQTIESAGTITLTGSSMGLAGGTIRSEGGLIVNAPLTGHGTLDAIVSGTGSITNASANALVVGGLAGSNAISSSGELKVGHRNGNTAFSGTSAGTGTFAKVGSGIQTVTGSVSNAAIDVREGALVFGGPGQRLTTSVGTVSDGATLSLVNTASASVDSLTLGTSPDALAPARLEIGSGSNLAVAGDVANNGWIEITDGSLLVGGTLINAGHVVNNGVLDATINGTGLVSGSGSFGGEVTISDGAMLAPGNSPGTATFVDLTLGPGGSFELEIASAVGEAGTDWDMAAVAGALELTASAANPYSIVLKSLAGNFEPGSLTGFDDEESWSWKFLAATIADPNAIDLAAFQIDSEQFTQFNSVGTGTFSIAAASDGLYVNFGVQPAAVPEPHSAVLMLVVGVGALATRRRRRGRSATARPSASVFRVGNRNP